MTAIDWDAWRAAYPGMSYADHVAFYRGVWEQHPRQQQHTHAEMLVFFARVPGRPRVIELGGWRGEAATTVLHHDRRIREWRNLEICEPAASSPVCLDARYDAMTPPTWAWELPSETDAFEVAVLSHVIEHMSGAHLALLADWLRALDVRHVYLESPLRAGRRSWAGYRGSHVLELGWSAVLRLFAQRGFALAASRGPHVRFLRRSR